MSPWIATLERIFGGVDFIDGASFLRVAVGLTVIAFLLHVLLRWPDFKRIRWQFAYAVYWAFLLRALFFPMPVSRTSIAIFQIIPQPTQWIPLIGLFEDPLTVLLSWLSQNASWLLAFIPLGALSLLNRPKPRLRYLHGPAVSAALLLATFLLNRIMTADYLPIRMDRCLAWALGFLLGQLLVTLVRKILALRAHSPSPSPKISPPIPASPKNDGRY